MDAAIESLTQTKRQPFLSPWYEDAAQTLGKGVLVIDNLPRTVHGDPLARRLQLLGQSVHDGGGKLLAISYFALPDTTQELSGIAMATAPRFSEAETTELLEAYGCPSPLAAKIKDLVITATGGLPILIAAIGRYGQTQAWKFDHSMLESILRADFAKNARTDAKALVELTVPDHETILIHGFSQWGN